MADGGMGEDWGPRVALLGAPVGAGAGDEGTRFGPAALRSAGLAGALERRGCRVTDHGDVTPDLAAAQGPPVRSGRTRNAETVAAWARCLAAAAYDLVRDGSVPIFLGGDHSLSLGTVAGVARHWAGTGRELSVLWLDAHADFNTPATSPTGNLHGMVLAHLTGAAELESLRLQARGPITRPQSVHLFGARSFDPGELDLVHRTGIPLVTMRAINQVGVRLPLEHILELVALREGVLHVSFDVDILDPEVAPAVGTPVTGGLSLGQARLVMRMLRQSGLVGSLDITELNPLREAGGRTAGAVVGLVASLFGDAAARRQAPQPEDHSWAS
jgi:arginase